MTTGSAAKYSIPPAPSNLYNGEADIEDEDHYYRYRIEKSKDNLTTNLVDCKSFSSLALNIVRNS